MPSLKVTFELVTPAFAGAAERSKTDGLRPPALKALLRFWWRTMFGDSTAAQLAKDEALRFGSQDPAIGQKFRIVPMRNPMPSPALVSPTGTRHNQGSLAYTYMGYGAVQRIEGAFQQTLPTVKDGYSLDTVLHWSEPHPAVEEELLRTLWLVSALGGYGRRSRRGFGSIRVNGIIPRWVALGLSDPHGFQQRTELVAALRAGMRSPSIGRPATANHTAFSVGTKILIGRHAASSGDALDAAAALFSGYRRAIGARFRHGPGTGPDHKKRSAWLTAPPVATDTAPRGVAFGLPLNAKFTSGASVNVEGRRASPLLFKILRCGTGAIPIVAFLPSPLQASPGLVVKIGTVKYPVQDPTTHAVHEFLNGDPSLMCYENTPPSPWKGLVGEGWTQL